MADSPLSGAFNLDALGGGTDEPNPDADTNTDPSGVGALSYAGVPGAKEALQTLVRSSDEARAALRQARQQIAARKYNSAIALLAVGSALGAPTRTGSSSEGWSNAARALIDPLKEKEAFEQNQQKELLGIDTNLAGLDERTAQAQLQLAALGAKLGTTAAGQPLEKVVGPDGKPIYRTRVQARDQEAFIPPTAATNISLSNEKGFLGNMSEGAAKLYNEQFQAALKAPRELERNTRIRDLLDKDTYTGVGAGWKLNFDRALNAAGIDFGGEKIANTEQLASELAAGTLSLIKPSGLGGGSGFSNTDREFVEKVAGGTITLNKETLQRLSRLHDRAQRYAIEEWNSSYKRLTKKPSVAQQLEMMGYEMVPLPGAQDAPPDDSAGPGKTMGAPPPVTSDANPDDTAPARAPNAQGAPPGAPYGLAPAAWAVDPANPPPRAPPAAEAALKLHPERRQEFVDKFQYLPNGG